MNFDLAYHVERVMVNMDRNAMIRELERIPGDRVGSLLFFLRNNGYMSDTADRDTWALACVLAERLGWPEPKPNQKIIDDDWIRYRRAQAVALPDNVQVRIRKHLVDYCDREGVELIAPQWPTEGETTPSGDVRIAFIFGNRNNAIYEWREKDDDLNSIAVNIKDKRRPRKR